MINQRQNLEPLYLNISGFNIGLKFKTGDSFSHLEKAFKQQIMHFYQGFLLLEVPELIHYQITFFPKNSFETLTNLKLKKHFINFYEEKSNRKINSFFHISILQLQLVLRKAVQSLLTKNKGFIIHASASNIKGEAVIFVGSSGAGKSTAMNMLNPIYPALGDDSAIIKKEGSEYLFYQTHLIEKNSWVKKNYQPFKLTKVFFPKKAQGYRAEKITNKELISKQLLPQLLTEDDSSSNQVQNVLKFADSFHNFYRLHFSLKSTAELVNTINQIPPN